MKNILFAVFLFLSVNLQAQSTFSSSRFNQIIEGEKKAAYGKMAMHASSVTANYDVKYYQCNWNVDPTNYYIYGSVMTYFTAVGTGVNSISFDLASNMNVDSVTYHNTTVSYTHASDLVTIQFPGTLVLNQLDSVTVWYQGVPGSSGFGSFIQDTHNNTAVIWTLSEPNGSSDWWPCKNGLTDKADSIDVNITCPVLYSAVSNGLLSSISHNGFYDTYHWKHRYPIATYLICLAVTDYVEYSNWVPFGSDTLEVQNFVYPEDSTYAAGQTPAIVPIMQLYDTLFGVYPFQNEKYGHAQFNWGGGMEHQTITFVSGFDFDLISHELGHHWFGDKVTCNSWHDIWLNEGFATYLAMLCYEHIIPGQWLLLKQGNVSYITSVPDGSVYCPDTLDVNRIFDGRLSYTKGGMILNQLRWVIGDSAFFAGCNGYLSDAACAYGFASTDQFRQHMETACGQNLSYYFDDWYTGEGYPSYHIDWTHIGGAIDLVINQTQSHSSVSFFELPVPIEFTDGIHDTIVRFDNTFNGQAFTANLPFTPTAANLDPNYELITANNLMTGISEYDLESKLEVFPNPTTNSVAIRLLHSLSSNAILTLTDVSGRQLMTRSVSGSLVNLDLSKFSSGTYFISIADSQKTLYKTIIKQ